jgi:hypothetical protein
MIIKKYKIFLEDMDFNKANDESIESINVDIQTFNSKKSSLESLYNKDILENIEEDINKIILDNKYLKKYDSVLRISRTLDKTKFNIDRLVDKKNLLDREILDFKSRLTDVSDDKQSDKIKESIKSREESIKKTMEDIKINKDKLNKINDDMKTSQKDFDDFMKLESERIKNLSEK